MEETQNMQPVAKKKKGRYVFRLFVFLLIAGLVGTSVYYYRQYKKINDNPNVIAQEEMAAVTAQLSKLMELPADETPVLATVQNRDKLQGQDFFKNSQNGDKVLIYAQAKQAILYRPSTNKIIRVAPLILDQGQQGVSGDIQGGE